MSTSLPMIPGPQPVPSATCLVCEVCCRFPEKDSLLRPYFTAEEIHAAVSAGVSATSFPDQQGSQISVVPHPDEEGFICPAFEPDTHHCRIYAVRPLDCQLYPFAIMWDQERRTVLFGWDHLCPFLLNPGEDQERSPHDVVSRIPQTLPPHLAEQARAVADRLEQEPLFSTLAAHPNLITLFQPEVAVLHTLSRVTARLHSTPGPSP